MAAKQPKGRSGCFVLVSMMLVFAVIGGVGAAVLSSGKSKTPKQDALAYVNRFTAQMGAVEANIAVVENDVSTKAPINQIALAAQRAHDNLDATRNDFANTTTTSGSLGNAETDVFTAANDLKDSMGALVAYTGAPNPATLAHFTAQFQSAATEWNDGVGTIWRVAQRRGAPTLG